MTIDKDKIPFIRADKSYELVDVERLQALPNVHELLDSYRFLQDAYELQRKNILRLEAIVDNQLLSIQAENARLNEYVDDLAWKLKVVKHYAVIVSILSLGIIAFYTIRG
jgi:hypothetical protein